MHKTLRLDKKLILDFAKWRSGTDGPTQVGRGCTMLRNSTGYECCLGQWVKQLVPELAEDYLEYAGRPIHLMGDIDIPKQIREKIPKWFYKEVTPPIDDNNFARRAMLVNDSNDPVPVKLKKLSALCLEFGYELEVINLPEQYQNWKEVAA